MVILLIHNGDGLSHAGISGGALRSFEMIRRWATYPGVSLRSVTTSGGRAKLTDAGIGAPATMLKASIWGTRERFRFYRMFSYVISALDFRRRERDVPHADIAFTASDFFCDTSVAQCLKRRRPSVFWAACVHHLYTSPWRRPGNPIVNWGWFILQRISLAGIARQADCAFVYDTEEGDRARDLLLRMGMSAERIRPMWNGVDLRRYTEVPTQEQEVDAIFVGEHRPNKGIYDIVAIWREVHAAMPQARLRLVGFAPEAIRARLTADIAAAGLREHIELCGERRGEELLHSYRTARLFFMPSHEEGWGIAICEAMACGLPVVAYDLPAYSRHYRTVLHHVPCFDIAAFAREVVRLLQEPELRAESSRKGRELAAHFDWDVIARRDWESMATLAK